MQPAEVSWRARGGRHRSATAAAGLVLGAALLGAVPASALARTFDGSRLGSAGLAALLVVVPPLAVVTLAVYRPRPAIVAVTAIGMYALVRLVSDIGALQDIGAAVRPDLFYERGPRALPLTVGGVGALWLVAADLVMVAAGAVGLVRLRPGWAADARAVPGDRWASVVGLSGAVVAAVGGVLLPVRGGYLDDRLFPADVGIAGVLSALLSLVLLSAAVLLGRGLPRPQWPVLLGAAAVSAAVQPVVELMTAAGSAGRVHATGGPWVGLVGAALVGVAAVVAAVGGRVRGTAVLPDRLLTPVLAGAGVLAMAACGAAALSSGLHVDGRADTAADAGLGTGHPLSAPIGTPFAIAGVLLLLGVLLTVLGPPVAGRILLGVGWVVIGFGVSAGLVVYSQVTGIAAAAIDTGLVGPVRSWTLGPGLWWGMVALLPAVAAAGVAGLAGRRARDVRIDVSEPTRLPRRWLFGGIAAVAAVVAAGFPVYRTAAGTGPALSLLDVGGVGVAVLTGGAVAALAIATLTGSRVAMRAAVLVAAVLVAVRLVVTPAVRALPGFGFSAGLVVTAIAVALILLCGGILALGPRRASAPVADPGDSVGRPRQPPVPASRGKGRR